MVVTDDDGKLSGCWIGKVEADGVNDGDDDDDDVDDC